MGTTGIVILPKKANSQSKLVVPNPALNCTASTLCCNDKDDLNGELSVRAAACGVVEQTLVIIWVNSMHNVHAIIGFFTDVSFAYPSRAMPLPHGLTLVPVSNDFYRAKCKGEPPSVVHQFEFLTPEFLSWLELFSIGKKFAYIETDYFGGAGGQGAVLLENGNATFGPQFGEEEHVNSVLRLLGIKVAADEFDEFNTVDLGRHRSTDRWLSDEED